MFDLGGEIIGPRSYNKLRARPNSNDRTQFLLVFGDPGSPADGYQDPNREEFKFIYIVKAIGLSTRSVLVCTVIAFTDEGILLRVALANGRPAEETGFMVEISLFGDF
jgi:hypothetical protein